ncbi:MAG: hydrogenase expression/formation protein HypE [Gammaproteobacteria bacterium]|nr:hydrogenase expression/formation protein HypE [Gammaproteobacteria bacterium]
MGSRPAKRVLRADTITLTHGAGGKAMRDLIQDVFVDGFDNPTLAQLEDQARLDLNGLVADGDRLAMTTDSFVVDPLFFPGGDIGTLAVAGTVNDLAVGGAIPRYLTCGMIIEEGLPVETLRRIVRSMRETADAAGVEIVTGDTKVVHKGAADKLFVNTAGVGVIPADIDIDSRRARPGDVILINGHIGDHGAAIATARGDMALDSSVESDCAPLNGLIRDMLAACPDIRSMRDATRGGIATVLNEFAEASDSCLRVDETALPVRDEVRGLSEILGLDPLYLANEGKLVAIVPASASDAVLAAMRAHPLGRHAARIGEVSEAPSGRVILQTGFGGERIVDMLVGEQLPRIC